EPRLRELAFAPRSWSNRVWDSGEKLFDFTYGAEAEAKYGAPYLLMHRGDLHDLLHSTVPAGSIAFEKTLTGIARRNGGYELRFADGMVAAAEAVIGADGVHSRVREILLGPEKPRFTGRVAHRTVFGSALMNGYLVETCTKWWGPDRHIVIYPVNPRRDETYFVTSVPDPDWNVESWSARGDMDAVRRAFGGFHDDVQKVLANCPSVHQWALFERDPLPRSRTPRRLRAVSPPWTIRVRRCAAMRRRARTALPASSLPRGRITGVRAPPIRDGSTATTRSKRRFRPNAPPAVPSGARRRSKEGQAATLRRLTSARPAATVRAVSG